MSAFFKTDADLINWIKIEKLDCLFKNNEILPENLIWFSTENAKKKRISEMKVDEIYNYLAYAKHLIKARNMTIQEIGSR